MLKLTNRVNSLKPSPTMAINAAAGALRAEGKDVISLAAGEPDFNTPKAIRDAAAAAIEDGITKYTPAPGFLALREAIARKVSKENGFPVEPDEIIVTSGAKHALYNALQCLAQEGDTVLVPTPAWVSYGPMIELAGAQMLPLPLMEEDGFRINVDRWKNLAIPDSAKGIIINSPSNPTGITCTKEDLNRLVAWALSRNLWIISDEIYEKILYDGATHTSVASLGPEAKAATITISGFSKSHCMTGWRLGWAIGDKALIKKMSSIQSQSTSHVTSFVQRAGLTACELPDAEIQAMVEKFDTRRHLCMERLDKLKEHVSYIRPNGAFYIFINLSKWLTPRKMSDVEFCKELLNAHFVGMVPGSAFGAANYVRMSYATSEENLTKSFDRLEEFLKS